MQQEQLREIIQHLRLIQQRPGMYIGSEEPAICEEYLAGFDYACLATVKTTAWANRSEAFARRQWVRRSANNLEIYEQMKKRGITGRDAIVERFEIEIAAWEIAGEKANFALTYSDISLYTLKEKFGIELVESPGQFTEVPPVPVTDWIQEALKRGISLTSGMYTEKSRAEYLISPLLSELREFFQKEVWIFSGENLDINREEGLMGCCDFLIGKGDHQQYIQRPLVSVVQPMRGQFKHYTARSIAEMVGIRRWYPNVTKLAIASPGCVMTDGSRWRFLQIAENRAILDTNELSIDEPEKVLGAFVNLVWSALDSLQASETLANGKPV